VTIIRKLTMACVCALMVTLLSAHADEHVAQLRYTSDMIGDVSGGLKRGAHWIGRFDFTFDTGTGDDAALLGVPGLHAFTDIFLLHGGGFSDRNVGDAQVVSNVDAPHAIRPFEAWLEAPLAQGLRAKAGFIDLNSEFDVQSVGAIFLNSSFGIAPDFSQSGLNGPSIFPVTAPGLLLALERERWTLRTAMFDAVPGDPAHTHNVLPDGLNRGGALLAVEGEVKIGAGGELQFGNWLYTNKFDRLDRRGRGQSMGSYIQYEQLLAGDKKTGALRGWLRTGHASPGVNPIGIYAGGGFSYGTEDAHYGIAVAHARLGDDARRAFAAAGQPHRTAETTLEITASRRLTDWLALQPDMQYVSHPSWGVAPDALVVGLRLHLEHPL
jgi:porin